MCDLCAEYPHQRRPSLRPRLYSRRPALRTGRCARQSRLEIAPCRIEGGRGHKAGIRPEARQGRRCAQGASARRERVFASRSDGHAGSEHRGSLAPRLGRRCGKRFVLRIAAQSGWAHIRSGRQPKALGNTEARKLSGERRGCRIAGGSGRQLATITLWTSFAGRMSVAARRPLRLARRIWLA